MKLLLITGEISGDMYGAALCTALKESDSDISIHAFGGSKLRDVADTFLYDVAHLNHIGLGVYGQKHRTLNTFYDTLDKQLDSTHYERAVLIDFQHHNFEIAKRLQNANIPITTFITPNFWLWKDKKKAAKIAGYSDAIITIFPQEYELYRELHHNVHFFGHPLLDMMDIETTPQSPFSDKRPIISFFPGSRQQEFKLYLDKMLATIERLPKREEYHIVMALSDEKFRHLLEKKIAQLPFSITLWDGDKTTLFKHSRLSVCASGTATLQAVLCGTPLVILAALPPLTYYIAKYLLGIKLRFVTLPNIIAQHMVVPELVQSRIRVPKILNTIQKILDTPHDDIRHRYDSVISKLKSTTSPLKSIALAVLNSKKTEK
jgi:lipid-A-disaccharide synthase